MKVNYTLMKGNEFLVEGVKCKFEVTSFGTHFDLNKVLERMALHETEYKAVSIRIATGISNEPVYQILSLRNESFDFYKNKSERIKAMGA